MADIQLRTPRDFGAVIRERRRALGLDQAALAARIGVSRLWVSEVERGKPGAGLGLVLRALAALDIELTSEVTADNQPGEATAINAVIERARGKARK
ncbi:MAG: helix-turn-helix domain-containing protein [Parvularculaceae bacterium]